MIATAVIALRHYRARWCLVPPVARGAPMTARYFGLGIFSRLLVSIFIVLEPAQSGARGWPAVAACPMVLWLGVMEWQLHSLRAGARNALVGSGSLGAFAGASRRKLALATFSYFAVLAVLTGLVQGLAYSHGVHTNWALLVAGTFFSIFPRSCCGRLRPDRRGAASVVAGPCHIRRLGGRRKGYPAEVGSI